MGQDTKIEWATHTFNPWIGCTKVSPACAHCYAESYAARYGRAEWGPGKPRQRTGAANWKKPLAWDREAKALGVRHRVFSASLADWLDDEVPIEWLADLLSLIYATPNLDWLLLTKRPENWSERIKAVEGIFNFGATPTSNWARTLDWLHGRPPANVWMGCTVENQECADARIPALLAIPARVRFLSCEPLLGPLDLTGWADATARAQTMPVKWSEFCWPEWVTLEQRRQVENFWGESYGRGPGAWNKDNVAQHTPAFGAIVGCDKNHWVCGADDPAAVARGKYMHAWNNIGRIFTGDGKIVGVSSPCGPGWLSRWLNSDGNYAHRLHWVIAGGESGHQARPSHPDWFNALRDQCTAAGVAFFFKQWGEFLPDESHARFSEAHAKTVDVRLDPDCVMMRVGKKSAGRLLDGREWNDVPSPVGGGRES